MRNAPKFPFVKMPTATLGRLFISAIRYALRSDDQCLIKSVCDILRYCYLADKLLAPMCDVIIEDIRRRHEFFRDTPGSARHDDTWLRLLFVLTDPPVLHCPLRGANQGAIVSIKQNELVTILSAAVNYALGRHSIGVSAICDCIRDLAPKIHHNDRASLASDIRCYLEQPRSNEAMFNDHHWRDSLEFLNTLERQAFTRSRPRKPRLR